MSVKPTGLEIPFETGQSKMSQFRRLIGVVLNFPDEAVGTVGENKQTVNNSSRTTCLSGAVMN